MGDKSKNLKQKKDSKQPIQQKNLNKVAGGAQPAATPPAKASVKK